MPSDPSPAGGTSVEIWGARASARAKLASSSATTLHPATFPFGRFCASNPPSPLAGNPQRFSPSGLRIARPGTFPSGPRLRPPSASKSIIAAGGSGFSASAGQSAPATASRAGASGPWVKAGGGGGAAPSRNLTSKSSPTCLRT